MGNTLLGRVGAVENAFCAFSKDLVGAFCASTGPAASTRGISLARMTDGREAARPFVEPGQADRAEVQHPNSVIDFLEEGLRLVVDVLGVDVTIRRSTTLQLDPALRGQERLVAAAAAVGWLGAGAAGGAGVQAATSQPRANKVHSARSCRLPLIIVLPLRPHSRPKI